MTTPMATFIRKVASAVRIFAGIEYENNAFVRNCLIDGECDWTAGILACNAVASAASDPLMNSKRRFRVEATLMQARMPAVQSVDD